MNTNIRNIVLSVFAAAVIALTVMSASAQPVYAEGEDPEKPEMLNVEVGGVRVTDANKDGVTGENIRGTVTYDPETLTLTLKNAYISEPDDSVAIKLTGKSAGGVNPEFTIVCEGKNRIVRDEEHWDFTGIGATSTNVTIKGGKLMIASPASGSGTRAIDIKGGLTIDGVDLTALAYERDDWFYCIYADGKILVKSSSVDIGEINDTGDGGLTYGFAAGSGTVIDHSVVNITIGPDNQSSGVYQTAFYRSVTIQNGSLLKVVSGVPEGYSTFKDVFYQGDVMIDETSAIEVCASSMITDNTGFIIPESCKNSFLVSEQMTGDDPVTCEYTYSEENNEYRLNLDGKKWLKRSIDLSGDDLKVTMASDTLPYTGEQQRPVIQSIGGLMLKEGVNYTADWPEESVKTGDYTVNITLKSPLSGTTQAHYSIERIKVAAPAGGKTFTYDGKKHYGADENDEYTLTGNSAVNAGTYTAVASLINKTNMTWDDGTTEDKEIKYTIKKAPNTLNASGKTVNAKFRKLKKKAVTIKRAAAIKYSGNIGKVTYKKVSVNKKKFAKKFLVNKKTGKITIKKGVKKGLYKFKIKVTAAGNANYQSKSKTVTVKIKVR